MRKIRKIVFISIKILITLTYIFLLFVYILLRDQLATILSVKKIDYYPFYEMNYKADYYFDEYLQEGSSSIEDTLQFISKN